MLLVNKVQWQILHWKNQLEGTDEVSWGGMIAISIWGSSLGV
jgi:hypothetical protein